MSFYGKIVKDTQITVQDLGEWQKLQEIPDAVEGKKKYEFYFSSNDTDKTSSKTILVPYNRISDLNIVNADNGATQFQYVKFFLNDEGVEEKENFTTEFKITGSNLESDLYHRIYEQAASCFNTTEYNKNTRTLSISADAYGDTIDAEEVEF